MEVGEGLGKHIWQPVVGGWVVDPGGVKIAPDSPLVSLHRGERQLLY